MFGRDSTVGHKKALRGFFDLGPSCQWLVCVARRHSSPLQSGSPKARLRRSRAELLRNCSAL